MKFPLTALVSNDEINLVRGGGQVKTARHQQPVSAFLTRLLLAAAPAAVHCCGGQVTHPAAVHQPPTVTAAPSYLVPRFLPPSSSSCRHLGCFHTHTLLSVYALLSSTCCVSWWRYLPPAASSGIISTLQMVWLLVSAA